MNMRLLLSLMLMAAFSTAMSAQDMEQTAAPSFIMGYNNGIREGFPESDYNAFFAWTESYIESIENEDQADASIYYRFNSAADWREYTGGEITFSSRSMCVVEAYAVAEGKLPSEIVSIEVFYMESLAYAVCSVDGISYRFNSCDYPYWDDRVTEVSATSYEDSHLYTPPYSGSLVIPSEIVFRDKTFTVTEIYYKAFASTYSCPCEITSVELPSTITQIWQSAFAGCVNLNRMVVHAVTPPYTCDIFYYEDYDYYNYLGLDADALYDQVTLFVPSESVEAYRAHEEWGKFTHIVPFIGAGPGDINGDGNIAINDVSNIIDQLLGGEDVPAYCDVNGDGVVSITDMTALIDMLLNGN